MINYTLIEKKNNMDKNSNLHLKRNYGTRIGRIVCLGGILLALAVRMVSAQPWQTNGWEVAATPEDVGMNSDVLDDFNTWFIETKNAKAYPWGYVIIRNGKIATEKYGNGGGRNVQWDFGSNRKSVYSALLGMAIKEGKIKLGDNISKVWPPSHAGYVSGATIQCYFNASVACTTSCDCFKYDNCYFTYAGQILGTLYQMPNDEIASLATGKLIPVLGLNDTKFFHAPVSASCGKMVYQTNLPDAARFCYLWLNKGKWENRELFTEQYATTATTKNNPDASYGDYGLCWFVNYNRRRLPDCPADLFWNFGNGFDNSRTLLAVVPSKNLILVLRCDSSAYDFVGTNYRTNNSGQNDILKRVLAAVNP